MCRPLVSVSERVLKQTQFSLSPDGCWIWIGAISNAGYAHMSIQGKSVPVHRVMYSAVYGEPAKGLELHHKCFNKDCVRPDHLEALTHSAHMLLHNKIRREQGNA